MTPQFGDLYLVRTKSWFGRLVRFWTRSRFSHGGIVIWKNRGVEATWRGVRIVDLSMYDGQEVVYMAPVEPLAPQERRRMSKFLAKNLGKPYDYEALLGFLFFKRMQNSKKLYCFELQFEAYRAIGRCLVRLDNEYVDGRTIYSSLALEVKGGD